MTLADRRLQRQQELAQFAPLALARNDESVAPTEHKVGELHHLLTALLCDSPDEVEPEIQRTLADDALDEALEMYRRIHAEYTRLGELQTPRDTLIYPLTRGAEG